MRIIKLLFAASAMALLLTAGITPARADYKEAVALYSRGEYEKAIQELQPDLENNRDWEFGHRLLGLCYLSLNNNALAASSLSRAADLGSTSFSTYLGLAQAYFNMKKYGDCVKALERGESFAAKDPSPDASRAKLYNLRGSAYYRMNAFKEAIADLTRAMRLTQPGWTDYTMLGIAFYNESRTDEAVEALEKTLSLNPDQPAVKEILGKAFLNRGADALSKKQFTAATGFFKKAEAYDPGNGFIYYNLAETYLFSKNYTNAEKALNQAAKLLPGNADVLQRLGLVYEKMKKWDLSLDAYKKAQKAAPSKSLTEAIERVENNKKQ
jgi:tetratricopeptide (TPR) repeat protein